MAAEARLFWRTPSDEMVLERHQDLKKAQVASCLPGEKPHHHAESALGRSGKQCDTLPEEHAHLGLSRVTASYQPAS